MRRAVLATVLALTGVVLLPHTAMASSDTCDLLTKKQATKVLGLKVVKTELETSGGVEQCSYRTKKYWTPRLKELDAPFKLNITTQPLTRATTMVLDQLEADLDTETVEGLGDRAFFTDGNDLIVVVGDVVLQAEVTNIEWEGDELQTYILDPELAAMRLVVSRLAAGER